MDQLLHICHQHFTEVVLGDAAKDEVVLTLGGDR